jgi:hypothetical protein
MKLYCYKFYDKDENGDWIIDEYIDVKDHIE